MNKRKISFLAVLALLFIFCLPVLANEQKVVDMAGLLSDGEIASLQERLTAIAEEYQCDVAIVTTTSCGGKSPQDYTDDYYYQNGYGYGTDLDGIILMVSMKERKFHLATRGSAIDIFTDYGLQEIDDRITEDLHNGDYYEAFETFADLAEEFNQEAEEGEPYDVDHPYEDPMPFGTKLAISFAVALIVAVLVVVLLFLQLRSVAPNNKAQEYVRRGSFRVTRSRDLFLYRTVTKHRIERSSGGGGGGGSSMHHTSDGGRAGGHTGSF